MKLTHIRLCVTDVAESVRWYTDVLGLSLGPAGDGPPYAELVAPGRDGADDLVLALFERGLQALAVGRADLPESVDVQDPIVLCLHVDDLDAAVADLRDRGAEVTDVADQQAWGLRVAYVRDPSGNLIELNTPRPEGFGPPSTEAAGIDGP